MRYTYSIAGITVEFQSETSLKEDSDSAAFRCDDCEKPHIRCIPQAADALPTETGRLTSFTDTHVWYRDGDTVRLYTTDIGTGQQAGVAEQKLSAPETIRVTCTKQTWGHFGTVRNLWAAIDLAKQLMLYRIFTLHSSSIEVNGKAVLFSATSGTGKTTQAALWNRLRGVEQYNGDKNVLKRERDGIYAYGFPLCGASGICRAYRKPLGAIVFLSQASENRIERLSPKQAMPLLIENGYGCLPGRMNDMLFFAADAVAEIPMYRLACTPDERAVSLLEQELHRIW